MGRHFLRTKVARRILLTFLVGAIVPITLMAALSFGAVTNQLRDQSRERLGRLAKASGMAAVERIWTAHAALSQIAAMDLVHAPVPLPPGFRGVGVVEGGDLQTVRGRLGDVPPFSADEVEAMGRGRPVVRVTRDASPPDLFLAIPSRTPGETLVGRVVADSVWVRALDAAALPTTSAVCFLDHASAPLACGLDQGGELAAATAGRPGIRGVQEVEVAGEAHLVAGWEVYLPASFEAPPWSVVVSESRASIYGPVRTFSYAFPLALVLGLAVIGLLANVQIRRTMEPLDELTDATRRVASGDLVSRVAVTSNDEFADLAVSFNQMASELHGQFALLEAGRHIDEVALTELDRDRIVATLLRSCAEVFPGRRIGVLRGGGDEKWRVWGVVHPGGDLARDPALAEPVPVPTVQAGLTARGAKGVLVLEGLDGGLHELASAGYEPGDLPLTVVPLTAHGELRGGLAIGGLRGMPVSEKGVADVRDLIGRAALGVQSARLVGQLEEMSWGTLRALARAIDAKSPWTAGHSERVAALGLALGDVMGLNPEARAILERGGLLHDVGKIGIPASVLDHPGRLSEEQFAIMRSHPVIGATILEPIVAFAPALPIVRSHHERWDGKGYPDGLAGEDIDPLARILAVADVFDAMVSERPYRGAMDESLVHDIIRKDAGVAFDPAVVEALDVVLGRGWNHQEKTYGSLSHVA